MPKQIWKYVVVTSAFLSLGPFMIFAQGLPGASTATSTPQAASASATASVSSPHYDVASIRQNLAPEPHWRMNFTDNGVSAKDVTLLYAIQEAYGIYDDQLWINVPKWIEEKRFDIEAKYDAEKYPHPTPEQRQAMLQQLLADRFQLSVHREQREFPIYALQLTKNGPKFYPTKPEDIQVGSVSGQIMCHVTRSRPGNLAMQGCTMDQFAKDLTGWTRRELGRTIVDRTGLDTTGPNAHYDLSVTWTRQTAPATNSPAPAANNLDAEAGPTIFTALQEQLGLTLKSDKAPLPTIVIDHVEMPTEN
jgi:uncharacterized protein (TIGR03435 family)